MKIRFCSFLTIALFLLPALQGAERDSLSLLRTIAEYEALPAKWIETVYTNPATRYYQHCTSLTRISLNGVYGKEDEAALLQAGDGYLKGAIAPACGVTPAIQPEKKPVSYGTKQQTSNCSTPTSWPIPSGETFPCKNMPSREDIRVEPENLHGVSKGATVPHWNIVTGILVRRTSSRTSILPAEVPCDWINMSWEYRSWHKYTAKTTRSTFMPRWVAPISIR